jgi:hypothetical protein
MVSPNVALPVNGYADSAPSGYCAGPGAVSPYVRRLSSQKADDTLERTMRNRVRPTPTAFLLLFLLAFLTSSGSSQNPDGQGQMQAKGNVVYVCACLKTKSCSCMTEAKMEGPCACGTAGGPPLKAVSKDSDWAKENRAALAK